MSQLHVSVRHARLSSFATLLFVFAAFSHSAMATPLLTPINTGNEKSLAAILDAILKSDGVSIPEPTTFALTALGLAGLGYSRRRKGPGSAQFSAPNQKKGG